MAKTPSNRSHTLAQTLRQAAAVIKRAAWDYKDLQDQTGKKFMLRFLPYLEKDDVIGYTPARVKRGYGYGRWEEFFNTEKEARARMKFLIEAEAIEDAELYGPSATGGKNSRLLSEWKEGEPVEASVKHASDEDEDEPEEEDEGPRELSNDEIADLVSEARKYAKGDYVTVSVGFKEFIQLLEEAGTEPYLSWPDRGMELRSDAAWDKADAFLQRERLEEDEIENMDHLKEEIVHAIEEETEERLDFDFPGTLLLRDESVPAVDVGDVEDENEMLETELGKAAQAAGVSAQNVKVLFRSMNHYGEGRMYLGIFAEVSDVIDRANHIEPSPSGKPVLVFHDSMGGSGDYADGKGERTISVKSAKDLLEIMDYGTYSLGDVFSTSDWAWNDGR